ncbi:MAG: SGNH/GDSL hydrolase family protein, partial [Kiritimatiellia bacterium]|nr:SGNH/GDSL hydrolase family protein [Kiritimatiellia bacterium]
DSAVLTADKRIVLRKGTPHVATPRPPDVAAGEIRLGNVWLSGRIAGLTEAHLFPVLETAYPEPKSVTPDVAERLLPKTHARLREKQPLRILAWGDSVTESAYLPREQKWQERFASRLRARYPGAAVTVVSVSLNGGTSARFLKDPPGGPYNFAEKVLAVKPDLIVSEFINDASLDEAGVLKQYGGLLSAFRGIGAEWVILTPHFSRPDWMGLRSENRIEADPRPYVRGLRRFAETHGVALADASVRWARLWRQGLPYSTLLVNNINHPDERGMEIFADALMALFP